MAVAHLPLTEIRLATMSPLAHFGGITLPSPRLSLLTKRAKPATVKLLAAGPDAGVRHRERT
ncbi:hypothetical protein BN1232_03838 [Mycobacterium lentiflavum]|uniref:Uncharacterized protein n=1 Tax=Mycobacterium lentiflavum TaxID=141349 RepID=A0A0E4CP90_MYCLN|nr:hypothetical protein BN1232_03838 [Mycobacterium lentiflavum]